ncbi:MULTISPECIES: MarR family winged helix-turn-helix transcriptional regulator [Streptomyces]|uniref:MarR family winged helix-turn-helix transcriptional regulator n=1 Tax=Streptomyces TaxID=1883 RepID=UPI0018DF8167|nr:MULTISPECIES: MarR family winged helix-turn-helix transcriptional regulator [Streptomyces]MCZ4096400.1 MarR family winged helix-turn-helix transcriptional regulator [Streptomyces sp. H39-C1]
MTPTSRPAATEDPACTPPRAPVGRTGISHAVFRTARAHRMAAGRLLRGAGLYAGQELLMMRLWDAGPQRQSELIKLLDLDPSTVTRMVQRLEQSGLVTRRPDPDDGRAVLVEATEAGHTLRAPVEDAWRQLEEITVAGLSAADRRELARLLARVEDNLLRRGMDGAEETDGTGEAAAMGTTAGVEGSVSG